MFKVTLTSDGIIQSILQGEKSLQVTVGNVDILIEVLEEKEETSQKTETRPKEISIPNKDNSINPVSEHDYQLFIESEWVLEKFYS